MNSAQIFSLVEKAYYANQLDDLFLGNHPYTFDNLKHIPANVATDIGAIIDNGMYGLYSDGKTDIVSMLVETIYELLSFEDAFSTWTAYFILRYQYRNEIKNLSPFKIVTPQLCQDLSVCVRKQKEQLVMCKEYVGGSLPNGLWGDIQRLEDVMLSNYGVSIL